MSKKKKIRKQLLDEITTAYARIGGGENSITPILYLALDGTLLLINEPGARNLGGVPEDFVGKKISEIAPDMAQTAMEIILLAVESGVTVTHEDLVELPSGKRWFLTNSDVIKNKSGEAIAFELTCLDVTEWKVAEQKAGLLTKVVEQSSEGIAVVNMDGFLLFANDAMAAIHGYSSQEVLGKHLSIFHSPKQMSAVIAANKQLRETGQFDGQLWRIRRDGSIFPSLMHNTVLHDESGAEIGIIGTLRDITELKWAEDALRESEERYRAIFEQAAGSIVLVDGKTGVLVEFNDRACENLGYTREEFQKLKILDFEVIESVGEVSKHTEKIIRQESDVFETKHRTKDGRIRDVLVSSKAIRIHGKDFIQNIWRDITESKQAAEALRQSEKEKVLILGSLLELISYQDKSLKIVWANEAAGDSVGQRPDELVGRYCYEVWHGRQEPCSDCPVAKSIESGEPHEGEITSPDGRIWHMRACPVLNEQGDVVGAVEVTLDITKRKLAEAKLQESEARYRMVVEDQTELICRFMPEVVLTFVNDAYCRYFGRKREELVGHSFMSLIPEEDREELKNQIAKLNRENPAVTTEHRVITEGGSICWQQWTNRTIFDEQGNIIEYQAVGRDVTEHLEAEAKLRESEARLFRAEHIARMGLLTWNL